MRQGTIKCTCGQTFYIETVRNKTYCIRCGKEHDTSRLPLKKVEPDGTDL
jgi:hypothetical protein